MMTAMQHEDQSHCVEDRISEDQAVMLLLAVRHQFTLHQVARHQFTQHKGITDHHQVMHHQVTYHEVILHKVTRRQGTHHGIVMHHEVSKFQESSLQDQVPDPLEDSHKGSHLDLLTRSIVVIRGGKREVVKE